MLYTIQTPQSPEQAGAALEAAATRRQFGVLAVHDLQASMAKHGLTFPKACRIYEVCQPQQAQKVLEANTSIATALPCRIAVYQEGQGTILAMIRPTLLLGLFQEPALASIAQDVERALIGMMEEVAHPEPGQVPGAAGTGIVGTAPR